MLDPYRDVCQLSPTRTALILAFVLAACTFSTRGAEPSACTKIWDTGKPLADELAVQSRTEWKIVPVNLLSLESDPAAAASDPGYYGCEYAFQGDTVVENEHLVAVYRSRAERVAIYSKADGGVKTFELAPRKSREGTVRIDRCRLLRNTGNDAALEVAYSGPDDFSMVFAFDETEIIELRPGASVEGVSVFGSMRYGVVPDFVGDDLIFDPGEYPSMGGFSMPSENMFLGLLEGQDSVLVITWPQGRQSTEVALSNGQEARRTIVSFEIANDDKSLYLAVLSAPGIWHEEQLKPSYLEKDVAIGWKRPFPAKWTTQLPEARVRTTYTFKETKEKIWRGVTGHYTYPVWFDADNAFFRLSKKIPPKGRSIIYCLEGRKTPASITTPVDVLKQTLGRQACESILDFSGRLLRTHHRRGAEGIRRACTCGCTEAIEEVFKAGQEVPRKEYVTGAVDDMLYFVRRHVERINEYREFADDMMKFLDAAGRDSPSLKPYLDEMQTIVEQIPQEYERNKENMKTLEYAIVLARETKALTQSKAAGNLPAYMELSKKWRAMGGAQDNVIGAYHSITRKLAQQAGYRCVDRPQALGIAKEIRRRCRQCLRNADGYEIWPDY